MINNIKVNYGELSRKCSDQGYYLIKKRIHNIVWKNLEEERDKTIELTKQVEYYKKLYIELKDA